MLKVLYRSSLACVITCHAIALHAFSEESRIGFNSPSIDSFQIPALETPDLQPDHSPIETDVYVSFIHNPNEGSMTEIYRSRSENEGYELIATIPAEQNEYVDRDLRRRTDYYYKLRATDDGQYSAFNEPTRYTTYSITYKPDLAAKALDENTIELVFTDNSYNDYQYVIDGVNDAESDLFEIVEMTDSGKTVTFTHEGLSPMTNYQYTVHMYTSDDQAHENIVSARATTSGTADYEPVFTATVLDPNTVELRLTDRSYQDAAYEIFSFDYYERVTLTDSGQTAVLINEGLQSGQRYPYTVDVTLKDGTTHSGVASATVTTPFAPPDFAPFIEPHDEAVIQFTLISENPISINEIYRSLSPTSGFELIASQPHTMQSFTDSDVVPDVTYYYKTRAIHDDPELTSEFSAVRNYTTHSRNYNPTLIARALDDHTIELSLTDHESNDDYYHIGAENFNEFVSMPDSGTTTTFIHQDGVEPGKTFNYLVTVFMNTYPDANISYVAKATVTIPSEGECTASGTIRREVWSSVQGSNVSQIPVNTAPSAAQQLDMFEGPTNAGVHYGARISGYVCVPASGAYTFWIASNDHSELWMSTDDSPANKVMIASVNGATTPRQWNKYSSQESAPLELIAGKRYYIEALHKQGVGTDNIAVGWPLPDGTMERPIPGSRLSPFTGEVAPSCLASGTITREYWEGVEGSFVSEIPIHRDPDATNALTIFEGPSNAGIHYGTRIRGYICPPATGNYLFYIASNDHSELWLSSDADPANKVKLAFVRGATGIRQWDKYASQQSAPIALEEGMRYYIEALHKQGVGTDNIAVAWQLPDGTWEAPIPGRRLSPFEDAQPSATARMSDHAYYEQINIYPNPVQSGVAELSIAGYEGIEEIVETDIEILNMTGEVVFRDRISCGGDCGTYLMNIDKELVPGVYFVKMKANDARLSRRLLVK